MSSQARVISSPAQRGVEQQMRFGDTLKIVTRNLRRRKGRTILTAIGVTIGTAAIVAMMSLAIGLKENAVKSVGRFGKLTEIEVYPGYKANNQLNLDDRIIAGIKQIPGVTAVMSKQSSSGTAEVEIGRKVGQGVQVIGLDTKEARNFEYQMAQGKYLGGARNEAVISYNFPDFMGEKKKKSRKNKDSEFIPPPAPGSGNPAARPVLVGKSAVIRLSKPMSSGSSMETREYQVRIVGVLDQGQATWGGAIMHLPMEMVKEMNKWAGSAGAPGGNAGGRGRENVYDNLVVKVPDRQQVEKVVEQIRQMGFNPQSPITQLKEINKAFMILQLIFGGIGAVSLLVATIGIINTMVMSILERTREIGIMKVLGATIPNVRNLFLLEAGTIGFFGGVSGIAISYGIAGIVNMIFLRFAMQQAPPGEPIGNIAVIPLWLVLFALAFATVVGVLAGIYPALRAARLSPLNAIRQE